MIILPLTGIEAFERDFRWKDQKDQTPRRSIRFKRDNPANLYRWVQNAPPYESLSTKLKDEPQSPLLKGSTTIGDDECVALSFLFYERDVLSRMKDTSPQFGKTIPFYDAETAENVGVYKEEPTPDGGCAKGTFHIDFNSRRQRYEIDVPVIACRGMGTNGIISGPTTLLSTAHPRSCRLLSGHEQAVVVEERQDVYQSELYLCMRPCAKDED